jgi:hypothetical protein
MRSAWILLLIAALAGFVVAQGVGPTAEEEGVGEEGGLIPPAQFDPEKEELIDDDREDPKESVGFENDEAFANNDVAGASNDAESESSEESSDPSGAAALAANAKQAALGLLVALGATAYAL